jgi:hypothetical protein
MRSSSAPASRLEPTTSETNITAIFRVSLIARPFAELQLSTNTHPELPDIDMTTSDSPLMRGTPLGAGRCALVRDWL